MLDPFQRAQRCVGDVAGIGGGSGGATIAAADATTAGNNTDMSVRSLIGALHWKLI